MSRASADESRIISPEAPEALDDEAGRELEVVDGGDDGSGEGRIAMVHG